MSEVGVELLGRYRRVLEHPRPSPCSGSDADVGAELLRGLQMACEIFMHAEEFSPDSVVGGLRWDWTLLVVGGVSLVIRGTSPTSSSALLVAVDARC